MDYLAALNRKEMKAWEFFYRDYYSSLCSRVFRVVKDRDCAEDIVQETLINIWHSTRAFHTEGDLLNYLYKAVHVNSLQHLRTRNLHDAHLARLQQESATTGEELSSLVREELVRQLHAVIRELPPRRRQILQLSLEGLSGKEIAERLGVTIHTVKTQKSLAFTYLRDRLGDLSLLLYLCFPVKIW
ncbi:MAG: RNA polymerase sigma-70 factor [Odoribacteraceae bacterium]|jgi:RNA polymerase sigma-70 factor (ECF subfamily)|nr:RNA polymerase sigma-70 factor [Odoribacteraceae bacterium]